MKQFRISIFFCSPASPGAAGKHSNAGSALVVVLWIVGLLAMLIASLAFDAHLEARLISYSRKKLKAGYLARSGLELAKMIWARDVAEEDAEDGDPSDRWRDPALQLARGGTVTITEALGAGTLTVQLQPEPARRDIRKIAELALTDEGRAVEILERIFEVGGIPEDRWPGLIDSFLDWIDPDDEPRLDGAESEDYYLTLDPPYRARNHAALGTVGELLLIKGFTRTIVYGGVLDEGFETDDPVIVRGIADLLTTYGSLEVNVNAANERVLMTIPADPEIDELFAMAIREERGDFEQQEEQPPGWVRENKLFKDKNDFLTRMDLHNSGAAEHITTEPSKTYRITSIGDVEGVQRKIWCIAELMGTRSREVKMSIKEWREEE